MVNEAFEISGTTVKPGTRATIQLPFGRMYTHTPMSIPVHVVRGGKMGHVYLLALRFMVMSSMALR